MKNESLKLFDTVAILKNEPTKNVVYGQVGTIVEILDKDVFEVEFADKNGETIAEFALKRDDLIALHHEMMILK